LVTSRIGFFRANKEKSNLIGWRKTMTASSPNHIHFLLLGAKKILQKYFKEVAVKNQKCLFCKVETPTKWLPFESQILQIFPKTHSNLFLFLHMKNQT
jgi:hypothetical protein